MQSNDKNRGQAPPLLAALSMGMWRQNGKQRRKILGDRSGLVPSRFCKI